MTECSECGTRINLAKTKPGDILTCPKCGTKLEVVNNELIMLWNIIVDIPDAPCTIMKMKQSYYRTLPCTN